MKTKFAILFFCLALLLPGCSALSPNLEKEPVENKSHLLVGHSLEVENTDSRFILVDDNSALAADGLYYVSWGMGDPTPYENSDGDTADLYDASLYLLLGESKDAASAQKTWPLGLMLLRKIMRCWKNRKPFTTGRLTPCLFTIAPAKITLMTGASLRLLPLAASPCAWK